MQFAFMDNVEFYLYPTVSRPSSSFNESFVSKSAKYPSEHQLVEFGIGLPVLVTETLSVAVGEL